MLGLGLLLLLLITTTRLQLQGGACLCSPRLLLPCVPYGISALPVVLLGAGAFARLGHGLTQPQNAL